MGQRRLRNEPHRTRLRGASWAYQTEMDKMDENGRWWKKMGKSGWKLIAWDNWGYQTEMANKDYISKTIHSNFEAISA